MTATTVPAPAQLVDDRYRSARVTFFSDTMLIFRRQLQLSLRNPSRVISGLI